MEIINIQMTRDTKNTNKPTDWNTGKRTSWPAPAPVRSPETHAEVIYTEVSDRNTGEKTSWPMPGN